MNVCVCVLGNEVRPLVVTSIQSMLVGHTAHSFHRIWWTLDISGAWASFELIDKYSY